MPDLQPGAYDLLVTRSLREAIKSLPEHLAAHVRRLEAVDAVEYLAREIADRARRLLVEAADGQEVSFLEQANRVLDFVEENNSAESALMTAVTQKVQAPPADSLVPLSQSALVTDDQESTTFACCGPSY